MLRRDFLRATSSVAAAITLKRLANAAEPVNTGGSRTILPLNLNWRFAPRPVPDAERPDFDDRSFETVAIPHTNRTMPWHNFDDRQYEFISTYRRTFSLPESTSGKRVFVDFEGAMTASTVWINGVRLGEYKGGFTPFSFELTENLLHRKANILTVQVDSTERADIPPFGDEVDYLTFGGIYREVSLRVVSPIFIDNVFARSIDVLSAAPKIEVDCFLAAPPQSHGSALSLRVELLDEGKLLATQSQPVRALSASSPDPANPGACHASDETVHDPARHTLTLEKLGPVTLWDLSTPKLYTVRATLLEGGEPIDESSTRIGLRDAVFTEHGFMLNGKVLKLRGLDRHQTFPFVGQAMPARVQRRDADILRHELHCNIVRTSHYPQSRHFLDRCDEVGLLVLEEITGWQHIGPEPWKLLAIDNVGRMIRRDWNHPSIILWGVRINESPDDDSLYTRTNALARSLDTTRQTGGIRNRVTSHLLEDVFTINDFDFPLHKPNHPLYLNTEFVGHTWPTKVTDDEERQREHTLRHARIHDQLASDPQYAGGIGWCAFDYNTHASFGAGDRICYHGVSDIFRIAKPAAGFYKSQVDPAEEIVLEPAFHWARGDEALKFTQAVVCSNCEQLKFYSRGDGAPEDSWALVTELVPDRAQFPHLAWPPFVLDFNIVKFSRQQFPWGDLRIDGYLKEKKVISRTLSGKGVNQRFSVEADDKELFADGADTTRVVLRVTDEYGAPRPLSDEPVIFKLEGPAQLLGENPFSLVGGAGAIWIRAQQQHGVAKLTASHPQLGSQTIEIQLRPVAAEVL